MIGCDVPPSFVKPRARAKYGFDTFIRRQESGLYTTLARLEPPDQTLGG